MLNPKPNKPGGNPLSLISIDKLFQRVIYKRLMQIAEKESSFSSKQLRFYKAKSTANMVSSGMKTAEAAMEANKSGWRFINETMSKLGASKYLMLIIIYRYRIPLERDVVVRFDGLTFY